MDDHMWAACGFKQPPLDELPPFRDPEWCPECRDAMEAEMKHQWRSVVVNKIHLWECQRCGWRLTGMGHHKLPKDDCPGRKVFR